MPDMDQSNMRMVLSQSLPDVSGSPQVRVTFGRGSDAIVYDLIELRLVRSGTEQAEAVNSALNSHLKCAS